MNQFTALISINDLLPDQRHYWVLHNGEQHAIHGGSLDCCGLLVFATLERAERFCLTIVKGAATHDRTMSRFKPKKISKQKFWRLAREHFGSFCVSAGRTIIVAVAA